MNQVLDNEYDYTYDRSTVRQKRKHNEIGISAVRGGTIVGEHDVIFAGTDEVIQISHTQKQFLLRVLLMLQNTLQEKKPECTIWQM